MSPESRAGTGGQHRDVIRFVLADPGVLGRKDVNLAMLAVPTPQDAVEEKERNREDHEPKTEAATQSHEAPEPDHDVREPEATLGAGLKPPEKSN